MREPDGPGTNKLSKIEGERVDLDVPFRILRSKTPQFTTSRCNRITRQSNGPRKIRAALYLNLSKVIHAYFTLYLVVI